MEIVVDNCTSETPSKLELSSKDKLFLESTVNSPSPGHGQGGESYEDGGHQSIVIQVDSDHKCIRSTENDPQTSPAPSAEMVQQKWGLSGLAKTFIPISAGEGFASLAVHHSSLSEKSRSLLFSADVFGASGFLLCTGGCIMQHIPNCRYKFAARLMLVGGIVTTICGYVLMMSSMFKNI